MTRKVVRLCCSSVAADKEHDVGRLRRSVKVRGTALPEPATHAKRERPAASKTRAESVGGVGLGESEGIVPSPSRGFPFPEPKGGPLQTESRLHPKRANTAPSRTAQTQLFAKS